jgi:capsular polysaccharide biosynthesis protein
MKPDLTFSKAARLTLRRSWFIVLCAIAVGAATHKLVKTPQPSYLAQTTLHVVDTSVAYDNSGEAIPATDVPRATSDLNADTFRDPAAAAVAAKAVRSQGLSGLALLDRLTIVPLTPTDVSITFAGSDPRAATALVNDYASHYVANRRAAQVGALIAARDLLNRQLKAITPKPGVPADNATLAHAQDVAAHVDGLATAASLVPQRITAAKATEALAAKKKKLTRNVATVVGAFLGLALGILVVLLLARFDRRIRSSRDLRLQGIRVVDVDSERKPESLRRLWAELELAESAIGHDVAAIAVTSSSSREGTLSVARKLAETFASSGTPALLVDAHEGWTGTAGGFPDDESQELEFRPLSANLIGLSQPLSQARLARLLGESRQSGQAVVIACPAVDDDPEALLLASSADVVVLLLRRAQSSWPRLERTLSALQAAVRRPVVVCFDRSVRVSASSSSDAPAVERVNDDVDVPVRL